MGNPDVHQMMLEEVSTSRLAAGLRNAAQMYGALTRETVAMMLVAAHRLETLEARAQDAERKLRDVVFPNN